MLHWKLGMALCATALALAACGGDDDSGKDTTTKAPEKTTTTAAADAVTCDRFTAEEVSDKIGVEVPDREEEGEGEQCSYYSEDHSSVVTVDVEPDPYDGDTKYFLDSSRTAFKSFEELSGIGDAGYVGTDPDRLVVVAVDNKIQYSVSLSLYQTDLPSHRDGAVDLLKALVG
jgi:hypothetical protein